MIVFPAAASERMISCSCCVSCALKRGGRLVHDDQLRVARERAEDLDLLLLGGAQPAGGQRRRAGRSRPTRRARSYASVELPVPEERRPPRLDAEEDVLGDRQLRDDGRLLRDRGHLVLERLARRAERDLLPVQQHRARRRGASAPATIRPSVDLPAPFSPTSAWTEPRATESGDVRRAPGRRRSTWRRPGARDTARRARRRARALSARPLRLELRRVRLRRPRRRSAGSSARRCRRSPCRSSDGLDQRTASPACPRWPAAASTVPYQAPDLTALEADLPPP